MGATKQVESGKVPESVLDDKLQRILTSMISIGAFDRPSSGSITANVTSVAHNQFVRALAAQATVLLKNDDETLPLKVGTSTKIAVIGDACEKNVIVAGNGSGHVDAPYVITPLQGITNRAGTAASVTYAPTSPQSAAVAAAKGADIAIVCTATVSGEGSDRVNLSLPYDEDELIAAVAAAQPNTVVQVTNPGAVLMPWKDSVRRVFGAHSTRVAGWLCGALTDIVCACVAAACLLAGEVDHYELYAGSGGRQRHR